MSSFDDAMSCLSMNDSSAVVNTLIDSRITELLNRLKSCNTFQLEEGNGIISYLSEDDFMSLFEIHLLKTKECEKDTPEATIAYVNETLKYAVAGNANTSLCAAHSMVFRSLLQNITMIIIKSSYIKGEFIYSSAPRIWTSENVYRLGLWLADKYNSRFVEHYLSYYRSFYHKNPDSYRMYNFLQSVVINACFDSPDAVSKEWYAAKAYAKLFSLEELFSKAYKEDAWSLLDDDVTRYRAEKNSYLCYLLDPKVFCIAKKFPEFKELSSEILENFSITFNDVDYFINALENFGLSSKDVDWKYMPDRKLMEVVIDYLNAGWRFEDIKTAIRNCYFAKDVLLAHLDISIFSDDRIDWQFVNSMDKRAYKSEYLLRPNIKPIKNFKKDFLRMVEENGSNIEPVIKWLIDIGAGRDCKSSVEFID